jgi:thiamine kinase-like enzyme
VPPTPSEVLARVRALSGRTLRVDELSGGGTNRVLRVRTDDGGDFVVRIPRSRSAPIGVDRGREVTHTRLAGDLGVGAPFVESVADLDAVVVGFVPGRSLEPADLGDASVLARVSTQLRALHAGPRFRGSFDLAGYRRRYLALAAERGRRLPSGFGDLADRAEALERAVRSRPEPAVPCHNDLVPANIVDDGSRVWLVDYEYAAMNVASFDLGNLAACAELAPETVEVLVSAYYGRPTGRDLARVQAWAVLCAYTWTAWAVTQPGQSSWAAGQLAAARAGLLGPGYRPLLAEVAAED